MTISANEIVRFIQTEDMTVNLLLLTQTLNLLCWAGSGKKLVNGSFVQDF